ncbi:hypothetical protein [Microbispora sp. NPDC049125]|uniref:hypothetical protein n=1 Tax=Microbispora sp. NPDC049125 TaxID=3154929 RepID=UPI003465587B
MRHLYAAALVALAVSITGCGGGDTSASGAGGTPTAGTGSGAGGDSRAAFTECLRKNGVTMPTGRPTGRPSGRPGGWPSGRPSAWPSGRPSRGPGGFPSPSGEMGKAFEACRSLMPQGAFGRGNGRGADPNALQAFRTCMKDNGAELAQGAGMRDIDRGDPKVAKALEKCRVLLPASTPAPTG